MAADRKRHVLVTSAGRRVSLVRFFKEALRTSRPRARVYAADAAPEWSAACRVADASMRMPRVDAPEYLGEMLSQLQDANIGLVVPTIDTELAVLAASRQRLLDRGIHVVVSDLSLIETFGDKRKSATWFEARGFEVPRAMGRDALTYPCFVKPYDGSLSRGARVLRSASDLSSALREDPTMLFMEYCAPADYHEYTVDCYYDRSGALRCLVPRRRVEVRGGEISKGLTDRGHNQWLYDVLWSRLATIEGARGCMTFQFFVGHSSRRVVAIECNPRFGGGFPLSWHAGARMPVWLYHEYILGRPVPECHAWEDGMAMVRFDQELVFQLPRSDVMGGQ